MTKREIEHVQRELLLDIILETSRYRVEEGDDDPFRVEVIERYKALCKGGEVLEKSVVERGLAKEAAKAGQHHGKLHPGFHRVNVGGRKLTLHESQLDKVEYKCSPTGYRWIPKPGVVPDSKENN